MKTLKYLILASLFLPTSSIGCKILGPEEAAKVKYLRRYSPRVWFHSTELFWPSSVEWSFNFLNRQWMESKWWLVTKENMKEPSTILNYFHGADPKKQWTGVPLKLDAVPVYAFWNQVDEETVDLVYYFYYPYNRGKQVFRTMFGNHVGDWEHVTLRLILQRDSQGRQTWAPSMNAESFCLAYHEWYSYYSWKDVPKVQGTQHPIIYSANGSHGSWLSPGEHKYKDVPPLIDLTDAGTAWDTWKVMECFDYNAKKGLGPTWKGTWPNWLKKDNGDKSVGDAYPGSGPVTHWGNPKAGRVWAPQNINPFKRKFWSPTYQWRLTDGVPGPVDKPEFGTPKLD